MFAKTTLTFMSSVTLAVLFTSWFWLKLVLFVGLMITVGGLLPSLILKLVVALFSLLAVSLALQLTLYVPWISVLVKLNEYTSERLPSVGVMTLPLGRVTLANTVNALSSVIVALQLTVTFTLAGSGAQFKEVMLGWLVSLIVNTMLSVLLMLLLVSLAKTKTVYAPGCWVSVKFK